jgi:hypothetical protein
MALFSLAQEKQQKNLLSAIGSSALMMGESSFLASLRTQLAMGSRSWEPLSRESGPRRSAIPPVKRWVLALDHFEDVPTKPAELCVLSFSYLRRVL